MIRLSRPLIEPPISDRSRWMTMLLKPSEFAAQIRASRKMKNLSLRALSRTSGVSYSAISRIEAGRFTPTFDNAVRLAAALDLQLEDVSGLIGGDLQTSKCSLDSQPKLVTEGEIIRQVLSSGRRKNLSKISAHFEYAIVTEGTLVLQTQQFARQKVTAGARLDCKALRIDTCWALAISEVHIVWIRPKL
jgi:transcriptional regulator with XRE-family HTH domain